MHGQIYGNRGGTIFFVRLLLRRLIRIIRYRPTTHHPTPYCPDLPCMKACVPWIPCVKGFSYSLVLLPRPCLRLGYISSSLEGELWRIDSCDYKDRLFATPPQTSGPRGTTYQPPFAMPEYWADVRLVSCLQNMTTPEQSLSRFRRRRYFR